MFRNYSNYEIYEDGRIWSYKTNRFLKPGTNKQGYQQVTLVDNEGIKKTYRLNRLIYEAVSGSPIPEGMQVNHLTEDKTDNRFESLNLLTPKQNINFGSANERRAKTLSKQVGAFKNGELVFTFSSTMEAGRNGFHQGHIAACCNGKLKTHKGYTWKYL